MNTTLWILQGLLGALFATAGTRKVTHPLPTLGKVIGGWVYDVPLPLIRTVGTLEILGAVGLVVPRALDIAPWLTWLAAAGLAVIMIGGGVVHVRRSEPGEAAFNVVLVALLAVVIWGRLGPYA